MTSTTINLNHVRKKKARAEKRAKADENVVKFGRTKAAKAAAKAEALRIAQALDRVKREE